jgi:hypothetical protein
MEGSKVRTSPHKLCHKSQTNAPTQKPHHTPTKHHIPNRGLPIQTSTVAESVVSSFWDMVSDEEDSGPLLITDHDKNASLFQTWHR